MFTHNRPLAALALTLSFAFGPAACDAGEPEAVALSFAEQKLAEPDALVLRAFVEQHGFEVDLEGTSESDLNGTSILEIPLEKPDGTTARLVFVNQDSQTVLASVPVGSGLPDELYSVAEGQVVADPGFSGDLALPRDEQYGCLAEIAFGCWLSCLGNSNPCCAPNCCKAGSCQN